MNVEGSNLLSLLSGSNDLEALQQAVTQIDGLDTEFSKALQQQLALLQQPEKLAEVSALSEENLQTPVLTAATDVIPSTLQQQEVAVGVGTVLPPADSTDDIINLEKTIDVLQDVMQHIEEVTDFIEQASSTVGQAINHVISQLEYEMSAKQHPGATLDVLPNASAEELVSETQLNHHLYTDDQELLSLTDAVDETPLISDNDAETQNSQHLLDSAKTAIPTPAGKQKNTENPAGMQELELDEAMDDLINKESKFVEVSTPKNGATNSKADMQLPDLNLNSQETHVHKVLPRMVADLAQMQQTMDNQARVDVPTVNKPLGHPQWQQEFGEKILWMQSKSVQAAEIKLNPQHLGPVSVRVDVNQDQATLAFTAQHSVVRDAIEAALPRLREMLQGQHINLADVNIAQEHTPEQRQSQQFAQQNSDQHQQQGASTLALDSREAEERIASVTDEIEQSRTIASKGLLNIFA